ncbi:hypothetical protein OG741_01485 [Streptomyces sp. NBC_01410]|uniref:hypothetical protein n=1 Tax=Streptomyces sp. NBC_01410 TaxID=2903856 RepID=UPI00324D7943
MTTTANTPESITATTALLEEELPRLEEHQQMLEKELASVTDRLGSVRTALAALQALSGTAQLLTPTSDAETVPPPASSADTETVSDTPAPPVTAQENSTSDATPERSGTRASAARKGPAKKAATQKQSRRPAKKAASAKPAKAPKTAKPAKTTAAKRTTRAVAPTETGGLTEQVLAVLSKSGGKAVRARDVAEALGRDDTLNGINTVRSTLDRLVATSRAQRAGRGLYQAPAS